jgi:cysteine-rich repeat protein
MRGAGRSDTWDAGTAADRLVHLHVAAEAARTLQRLHQVRGASAKTHRRMARAAAVLIAAIGLVGSGPLVEAAGAATPSFLSPFPFGLANVGGRSNPTFADLDGDGDLDAFIGEDGGNTIYFENTGSSTAPAFAASSANPFGLADVGYRNSPAFADLDGDGDLDAFIGNYAGNTIYFENTGSSTAPAFAPSSANPFGLADVGSYSTPSFADLDGDGDLDAFIGELLGNTIYFENTGTSAAPDFAASSANPFGLADVGIRSSPTFADLDGDGDLDAFIGQGNGNIIYFENTGTSAAPAFAPSSADPFGLAAVGIRSSPAFADLDGDGDLDAFIGETNGNTFFFENTGSSTAPAFAASSANPFGLADVGSRSSPDFADLDGDGDLDAFIGNYDGNTIYFENTGSSTAPAFAASSANPFGLTDVGFDSRPTFADLDSDGDLDAFIGNYAGNTIYFENTGTSAAPAFAASSANPFGLAAVSVGNSPAFADLDGDGDLDAFIGEGGNTIYFENTGSSTAPAFAAASTNPFGLANVGFRTSPTFADLDGDGDLDAFIGEFFGNTFFFENTGSSTAPAFAPSSADPFGLAVVGAYNNPAFADLDGDGDLDAFIGESGGNTFFFENFGCGNGGLDAGEECDDGNTNDADGCNTLCQTPGGDSDNDGVANDIENAAPNGGDANGDGIPDSTQPNVGSLPGATDGTYQTIVTDESCPIENLTAVALDPSGWTLPFGALAFELPGCESTRVTIYYHGSDGLASPPFDYVKQGPNPPGAANDVTYTLSAGAPHMTVFGSADLGFDPAVGFAEFTLADNVAGDSTGDDNRIVDAGGGPGLRDAPAVAPALGVWGMLGSLLALLGLARRRLR